MGSLFTYMRFAEDDKATLDFQRINACPDILLSRDIFNSPPLNLITHSMESTSHTEGGEVRILSELLLRAGSTGSATLNPKIALQTFVLTPLRRVL